MPDELSPSSPQPQSASKPLTITFNDKKELYKSYMGFVKNGAIFLPTLDPMFFRLGLKVFVIMKIKDEKTQNVVNKTFAGIVIWITPSGSSAGIGVSFGDNDAARTLKEFIEMSIVDVSGKADIQSYTI